VGRFAGGDRAVVAAVVEQIKSVVHARGHYVALADRGDVVQQAMIDVIHAVRVRDFSSDTEFRRFVRTIAHRRCVDWLRQDRRRVRLLEIELPEPSISGPLTRERRQLAAQVLAGLRPACRKIIALRIGRALSYAELSSLLGRSAGALRTQFYSCLRQARTLLDRLLRGPQGDGGDDEPRASGSLAR
jgi:RNA polymerase sigma factor (sigma-70 family)